MADLTQSVSPILYHHGRIHWPQMKTPVDSNGSTQGQGMVPQPAFPRIVGSVLSVKARGRFDLDKPDTSSGVAIRGPRLSGKQGTLDLWFQVPTAGTARTFCYLTDNLTSPTNFIALRCDTSNRPLVTITNNLGVTVAAVTPSYTFSNAEGSLAHVKFVWNSQMAVSGTRFASLEVGGVAIPSSDWSTDPTSVWAHFQPTHLVLSQGLSGDSDITDVNTIQLLQGSNSA